MKWSHCAALGAREPRQRCRSFSSRRADLPIAFARSLPSTMGAASRHPRAVLLGRRSECEALARLLDGGTRWSCSVPWCCAARPVLRKDGAAGLCRRARRPGFRVARVVGVESEMEFAFGGPATAVRTDARPDRAPCRRHRAMRCGSHSGSTAVMRRIASWSVLPSWACCPRWRSTNRSSCLVDDAQWLDRASVQTLAFVARRLMAEPVALVFAVREPSEDRELGDCRSRQSTGLCDRDARLVLASDGARARWTSRCGISIRGRDARQPAGPFAVAPRVDSGRASGWFRRSGAQACLSRAGAELPRAVPITPPDTQRLLLTAAAEPQRRNVCCCGVRPK